MAVEERQKVLLYVLVVPDEVGGGCDETKGGKRKGSVNPSPNPSPNPKFEQSSSFRYTRSVLQSTLQLMGCKSRHAFKISRRVFDALASESPRPVTEKLTSSLHDFSRHLSDSEIDNNRDYTVEDIKQTAEENGIIMDKIEKTLMLVQRKRSTVVISRSKFLDVICETLSEYRYFGPNQRADLSLACRIRERKTSMTILLCGTSGCGKSTLSTLLASRLGITTVVSTDSIRHMMRSFVDERDNPLLWASTYHAGEHLDPVAVAESKAKKKARKMSSHSPLGSRINLVQANAPSPNVVPKNSDLGKYSEETPNDPSGQLLRKGKDPISSEANINGTIHDGSEIVVSEKMLAIQGYKAQSEMVIDSLDRLITSWEQKCESVIVEGVHLSLNFVMGLMKKHPSIIPFLVFIENEEKHIERFAVRAKYMALDPSRNKYVKYIRNIRAIQDYLCKRADKHLVPKVNNTNVDRSIIAIHATIFSCIRRRNAGEQLYDPPTNTMKVLDEEYRNQCNANSFGSKVMLQVIRRRGSSRQLVALVNDDGSVARTWPFEASDKKEAPNGGCFDGLDTLMSIGNAQTVNLQFGNFGLSAFTSDLEGTSHTSSIDGFNSRGNGAETDSSHLASSCSSSPRVNGSDKELVSENAVSESEEEEDAEDGADIDTDNEQIEEDRQLEGSVDEESIRSDEDEMMDGQEDAYWNSFIGNQGNKETGGLEKSLVSEKKGLEGNGRTGIGLCSSFSKRPSGNSLHIAPGGSTSAKFNPNEDSCNVKNALVARAEKFSHNRSKSMPFLETHDSSSTVVIENSKV